MSQKLSYTKLKCLQGSHPFNGSCYFVSNKKYIDSESEKDIIIEHFLRLYKKNKQFAALQSTPLGTAAELASLPMSANWKNSFTHCSQLNNDSSLLTFSTNLEEFNFIVDLLKKLNFPTLTVNDRNLGKDYFEQELKYFIGLTYNSNFCEKRK